MTNAKTVTVWYDGACPLCRREIAWMRKLDQSGAVKFIDVARNDAICPINRADLLSRFHAQEGEAIVSGAAAFAAMWRAIPLLRPLGLAMRWKPAEQAFEAVYGLFLRVRPTLQRLAKLAPSKV